MPRIRVDIVEEIPGNYYRWFVCTDLSTHPRAAFYADERITKGFFYGKCRNCSREIYPKFDQLDQAKIWAADNGFLYNVKPYQGPE